MTEERPYFYVGYEVGWTSKPCARCGSLTATAHGWLYKEPPLPAPAEDDWHPVGQVFLHDKGDDGVVLARSEHPNANE